MRVIVHGRLNDEQLLSAAGMLHDARRVVREVSFGVEYRIKLSMPVRTGRARASWGHWTPQHLRLPNRHANPNDAEWDESRDGLSITQGSNVEYVEGLNAGHSRQAPAGFLEAAAEAGMRELDRKISDIMGRW